MTEPDQFDSIFEGEPPAEAARVIDQASPNAVTNVQVDEQGNLSAELPLGDINPFDHAAEQAAIRKKADENGTSPPPLPENEEVPVRNMAMLQNSADAVKDEMERRFAMDLGPAKVQVTAADRDSFVRSALLDTELVFDIPVDGLDITVKVAMAPDEFTNSASAALTHWQREDYISKDSDLQWLLAFQQMHCWYQVREINGVPTPWSDFWADGMPSIRELRAELKRHETFAPFFKMSSTRWKLILDAVRMAEMKYKICLQNWNNRSFFTGAGTG